MRLDQRAKLTAAGVLTLDALAEHDGPVPGLGAGTLEGLRAQARLQLRVLAHVTACRDVIVWSRTRTHAEQFATAAAREGFGVMVASDAATSSPCS